MRFVLIDRLDRVEPGTAASATMTFPADLEIFSDHFPGQPIVPGTLLVEAMAQTAGWTIAASLTFARWPLLVAIDRARFHRLVSPGETVTLSAEVKGAREDAWEVITRASCGATMVADARLLFRAFDLPEREGAEAWGRDLFARLGGDVS